MQFAVRTLMLAALLLGCLASDAQSSRTLAFTDNPTITKGLRNQGAYSAQTTYVLNDVVSSGGAYYLSLENGNLGNAPASSPSQWAPFSGVPGPVGPAGAQGPAGPAGSDGAAGPAGGTGPAGVAGATGATGPVGPTGPKGDTGATGPAGAAGVAGTAGATGPAGPQGATGPAGTQGPAGVNGKNGKTTIAQSIVSFGDSIVCGYGLPDSNCANGASPFYPSPNSFTFLIARSLGLGAYNYAIGGDQAGDLVPRQIDGNGIQPTLDSNPLYLMQIGTNDVVKGTGAYEATFQRVHQAALVRLLMPRELSVLPGDAALTGSESWSATSSTFATNGNGTTVGGACASGAGTLTATMMTYGAPIYGLQVIQDGASAGNTFAVTVDGVSTGTTYATAPGTAVATQNGTQASYALIRIPVGAGSHTVVASTSSGGVCLNRWGTLAGNYYAGHPIVLSGDLPNQQSGNPASTVSSQLTYNADIIADEQILIQDGADIRHVADRNYMLGTSAEMFDQRHSTALGHMHYAQAYLQSIQGSPAFVGGQTQFWHCRVACTPPVNVSLVYAEFTGNVTLPTPAIGNQSISGPTSTTPPSTGGAAGEITVYCFPGQTCGVQAPSGWNLFDVGGSTTSTATIQAGHSKTFSTWYVNGAHNWLVTRSN